MAVAVGVFFTVASLYGPDTFFMRYGRSEAGAWNIWKAERLDEEKLRAHDGGRVLWVVGSSITRDSSDEAWVNTVLEETGSPYRLAKSGSPAARHGVSLASPSACPSGRAMCWPLPWRPRTSGGTGCARWGLRRTC